MDSVSSSVLIGLGIGALVCGVFGHAVAENKGANGLTGFLLGVFLGPIGVLIAAFLSGQAAPTISPSTAPSSNWASDDIRRPPSPQNIENAQYRLWLTQNYSISRNDVLGEFVCVDRAFKTGEEALRYAHELEQNKAAAADALEKAQASKMIEEASDLGIEFDGTSYHYKTYKYGSLSDALAYAKLQSAKR